MFGTFMLQNYLMDLLRWSPEPSPQYCTGSTVYTALEVLYTVKLFHKIFHSLNTLPKYCTFHRIILASQKIYGIKLLLKKKIKGNLKRKLHFHGI